MTYIPRSRPAAFNSNHMETIMVRIVPTTPREWQIARSLGVQGWKLIRFGNPSCFNMAEGALVTKCGHLRWVHHVEVE